MAQVSARAGLSSEILHFIIGLAYKSFCLGKVLESVLISNTYRIGLIMRKLHRNPTSPIPNSGGSWTQDWRLRVLPWVSYTVRRHISSRIIALSDVADVDQGMRTLARLIGGTDSWLPWLHEVRQQSSVCSTGSLPEADQIPDCCSIVWRNFLALAQVAPPICAIFGRNEGRQKEGGESSQTHPPKTSSEVAPGTERPLPDEGDNSWEASLRRVRVRVRKVLEKRTLSSKEHFQG